jgi:2-oxoglutarate dehydrogenase complex dehydrogenase (E1) component-like enzyme
MTHGHFAADLDPLNILKTLKDSNPDIGNKYKVPSEKLKELINYKTYGFTESDLEREFYIDAPELAGLLSKKKNWKLKELIEAYKNAYCGKIGVEYMHIAERE